MRDVVVRITEETKKITPSIVFCSRNPRTNRYCVNLYWREIDGEKWIQIFCQEEFIKESARELTMDILEDRITDLTGYLTERRI